MPIFKPNVGALKAKRDIARLVQALKTQDGHTRAEAVTALGDLGDRRAVSAIVALLLADEKQLGEKVEAADTLAKLGDSTTIDALRQANEISRQRERATIEHLANSPDRTYRPEFYINRVSSDELHLRTTIANTIAKIGGIAALRALIDMLATEQGGAMEASVKNGIRASIVETVKHTGADVLPILIETIKHTNVDARVQAAHCLSEFSDKTSVDALLRAAYDEHEDFRVRQAALTSLGLVGDARVIPYLEDLTDDHNPGIVRDAKQCMMQIRQRVKVAKD